MKCLCLWQPWNGKRCRRYKHAHVKAQSRRGVRVRFANEKVAVDLTVNIELGYNVPSTVATLQEKVKTSIEGASKFKVQSVNVQVMNVDVPQ